MIECKLCNESFDTPKQLSWHVKHHNLTNKEYYDIFYKKETEGICVYCGKPTKFISLNKGYHQRCSKECQYNDKRVQDKRMSTNVQKYGYKSSFCTQELQNKIKEIHIKTYGVDNPFKAEEIQHRIKQQNIELYGVENPQQNREIQKQTLSHYKYNGLNFDSSWELAVYIYCTEKGIPIIRLPIRLEYYDINNKKHYYFPDFLINDELIEIKGPQYLDEEGKLKDKNKQKCMDDNCVIMWTKNTVEPYITYCINKFNNKYWYKQFKIYK